MTKNWKKVCEYEDFIKWSYKNSPYRVCAFPTNRGHWKTTFTSCYGTDSKTIRGNLGGGKTGKMKAKAVAKQFFEKNPYGCPPPGEITDYKI